MSTNGNQWKPSRPIEVTCPSGQKVMVKRPGKEFSIKAGRVGRTFSAVLTKEDRLKNETEEEYNARLLDGMSDNEAEASVDYCRLLLVAMCVSPKLYLKPKEDQLGPDDLPDNDFWFLVNFHSNNYAGSTVPVGETEVEAESFDTFRDESGVSGSSVDGIHLPITESERAATDTGLVDSAGA